jgi:hypothetical protein
MSDVSDSVPRSKRSVSAEVEVELVVGLRLMCCWKILRRTPAARELDPDACRLSAISLYSHFPDIPSAVMVP